MTLFSRIGINPFLRFYLAHGLVDATYSLLNTGPRYEEKQDVSYISYLTALIHSYWVVGSLLGSFVIHLVTLPAGLEFSLTTFLPLQLLSSF